MTEYNEIYGLIYTPPDSKEPPKCENATLGVKFSTDIFLSEGFLKQQKIPYKIEDLEVGPLGLCFRIRRDKS